uniref:N-terminal methionine N(alpha)-acetyltransferase NatE n=1 Tax=Ditylenchus dipsaci TaxID=166011 RepID=A0A915DL78_9BILA
MSSADVVHPNQGCADSNSKECGDLANNMADCYLYADELMSMKTPRCVGRCAVELGDISRHNVIQLKRLNTSVFPVSYNEKFYKEVVTAGELAKLAYLMTSLLEGFAVEWMPVMERYGIGTLLLQHVFELCKRDQQIKAVYLHVQTNNDSALDFYKKFGFSVNGTAEKYYKRIEPDNAYVLEKAVN